MRNLHAVFTFPGLKSRIILGLLITTGAAVSAGAASVPACKDGNQVLAPNNAKVLSWKKATRNQFKARALVRGTAVRITEDRESHYHFEIKIGPGPLDLLEVVYNKEFGPIPNIKPGMDVMACGDYITATERAGNYEASPAGAIIHWVHLNPRGTGHESGFLVIDGTLVGNNRPRDSGRH